jgi:hypothetical protein
MKRPVVTPVPSLATTPARSLHCPNGNVPGRSRRATLANRFAWVDAGCLHLDQHFTGVWLRARNLAYIEDLDAAVAIESHRFHELSALIFRFGFYIMGAGAYRPYVTVHQIDAEDRSQCNVTFGG